jgi:hypothetical protein
MKTKCVDYPFGILDLFTAYHYPFGILDLFTASDYPFGILDLQLIITSLVSSNFSY